MTALRYTSSDGLPSHEGSQHELSLISNPTITIPARPTNTPRFPIPPLPLSFLLSVLIGGTQLTLGLVAWHFTVSATQTTARMYAHDLQVELLDTVALRLQTHIEAAQRLTGIQAANWRSGIYLQDDRPAVMRQLLDTLTMYKDLVTTQTFTTRQGGLNGFFTRMKPQSHSGGLGNGIEYVKWETDPLSATLTESIVDAFNGTQLAVLSQQVGYNASGEMWVTQVGRNPTGSSPAVWSPAYTWRGNLWITLSQAVFNNNASYQGVACTDLDLAFISRVLSASLTSLRPILGNSATLYAFERESTAIIGTSNLSQYLQLLTPTGNRTFTLSEMGSLDHRLKLIASKLGPSATQLSDAPFTFTFGDLYVQSTPLPSISASLNWTLLLLFPSSTINDPLAAATSRSIGTVLAVVIVGIASSILVSLAISKVLHGITNDMHLLAQLQFRQVIASRDALTGGTSRIREVWMIQNAFFLTTKMFGRAVRRTRVGGAGNRYFAMTTASTEVDLPATEGTAGGGIFGEVGGSVTVPLRVGFGGNGPEAVQGSPVTVSVTLSTLALSSQASSGGHAGHHMAWAPALSPTPTDSSAEQVALYDLK